MERLEAAKETIKSDVKPWDDETDKGAMKDACKSIEDAWCEAVPTDAEQMSEEIHEEDEEEEKDEDEEAAQDCHAAHVYSGVTQSVC